MERRNSNENVGSFIIDLVDKAAITRKVSQNKATALLPTSFRISNAYFWACPVWSDSALIKNEEVSCGVFAGKFIESISETKETKSMFLRWCNVYFVGQTSRLQYFSSLVHEIL